MNEFEYNTPATHQVTIFAVNRKKEGVLISPKLYPTCDGKPLAKFLTYYEIKVAVKNLFASGKFLARMCNFVIERERDHDDDIIKTELENGHTQLMLKSNIIDNTKIF